MDIARFRAWLLRAGASLATAACLLVPTPAAAAAELARPEGPVILTVTGNIARANAAQGAEFDRAMLTALGVHRFRTSTPWTDGTLEFEGALLAHVLEAVGARGEMLQATAINDYSVPIPTEDVDRYPVLVAWAVDGKALSRRDKGPLWVMYPLDAHPELRQQGIENRLIWQLVTLEVK